MKPCIIVDLDGTVADHSPRVHHIVDGKKNWEDYYERVEEDGVFEWSARLVRTMRRAGYSIVYVTGRADLVREQTERWLKRHSLDVHDLLLMREWGDHRSDTEIKAEHYRRTIEPHYDVLFVLEDRKKVVDMYRNEFGLTVLQCAEGDF